MLRRSETGNIFLQLVAQQCSVANWNVLLHVLPSIYLNNLSRNKFLCCKLRQHVAQSRPDFYFLQQIWGLLLVLPPQRQLTTQQILKQRLWLACEFFPPVERARKRAKLNCRSYIIYGNGCSFFFFLLMVSIFLHEKPNLPFRQA